MKHILMYIFWSSYLPNASAKLCLVASSTISSWSWHDAFGMMCSSASWSPPINFGPIVWLMNMPYCPIMGFKIDIRYVIGKDDEMYVVGACEILKDQYHGRSHMKANWCEKERISLIACQKSCILQMFTFDLLTGCFKEKVRWHTQYNDSSFAYSILC